MGDYILREIDKIGTLLRALLEKAGALKHTGQSDRLHETAKAELLARCDLDVDTLLADPDFIGRLTGDYGFSEENLEQTAELLADFVAASDNRDEQVRLAAAVAAIYRHLDERRAPVSFNRYYVLKDLKEYIKS